MGKYLLKRLLIFIPTFFAVTLFCFFIYTQAPGDEVEDMIRASVDGNTLALDERFMDSTYMEKRHQLGLDRPLFYFSVGTLAEPDTLYRIMRPDNRAALKELTARYGNWPQVIAWHQQLHVVNRLAKNAAAPAEMSPALSNFRATVVAMRSVGRADELKVQQAYADSLAGLMPQELNEVKAAWAEAREAWQEVESSATPWKNYVPTLFVYGADCRYHHWLAGMLTGDMGNSFHDGSPVSRHIGEAVRWSIFLSLFASLLSYLFSVRLGTWSAVRQNTPAERRMSVFLFILYSLPSFWVATLLINFFATPDYLKLFPSGGVMSDGSTSWSLPGRLADYAWHMVLPTICYVYGSFVILSRQMRVSMLDALGSDYVRTARAKGLSHKKVVRVHALRNSLIPLITSFAHIFPALIGGSIILENIFNIPGIGQENLRAISRGDFPVIIGVFSISAVLSLLGILVSDILYAVADPRISYSRK